MKQRKVRDYFSHKKVVKYALIGSIISLSLLSLYYVATNKLNDVRDNGNNVDGIRVDGVTYVSKNDINEGYFVDDQQVPKSIPICDMRHSELIPCLDRNLIIQQKWKFNLTLMEHYERHCPPPHQRFNCLIPPPIGYKIPIRWPASRDTVWKANIPHTHLASEKSDQNWMVVEGDIIRFPGGGTHFHQGAGLYISAIAGWLKFPRNELSNGGNIRNVLDVGCGVASFGAYLLPLNIIAMSLAPNDVHANQIQFALERGIPSAVGVLGTKRLPYPSRSFELAHCSRCRIDWLQRDGILMLELDRLLRPGGYFVYSSPEAYMLDDENTRIWGAMYDLSKRLCWKLVARKLQTVIWLKPRSNNCYFRRSPDIQPQLCSSDDDPDLVWNVSMKPCITRYSEISLASNGAFIVVLVNMKIYKSDVYDKSVEDINARKFVYASFDMMHTERGSGLEPWPKRLTASPPRLEEINVSPDDFRKDTNIWHHRVTEYWKQMKSVVHKNSFRNVMDMNSHLGGFASALNDNDVWTMNVAPVNSSPKLKIVYDRGFIGTVHDWCESFSTYPRTYDLLHAWSVVSEIESRGCSVEDLLIEMDRLVRPEGFVIIRDKHSVINYIRKFLAALRWDGWTSEVEPRVDSLSLSEERVLIVKKKKWEDTAI